MIFPFILRFIAKYASLIGFKLIYFIYIALSAHFILIQMELEPSSNDW